MNIGMLTIEDSGRGNIAVTTGRGATVTADIATTNLTASAEPKTVQNSKERARRFSVQMPMRYRVNGQKRWWRGTTDNVSRSGVLFRGELAAVPNTALEMSMVLPGAVLGSGATEVACKGTVVRVVTSPTADSLVALATTISHYRLVRP